MGTGYLGGRPERRHVNGIVFAIGCLAGSHASGLERVALLTFRWVDSRWIINGD